MTAPSETLVGIVDDNPSVRKALARLVKAAGYRVEVFASAREFLARPQQEDLRCLLLDVRMPGLTGLDLQEALAIAGRRTSIVFVSGHGDVEGSVKVMKGGAIDFLTKPVDARDLLGAIERAVAKTFTVQRDQTQATDIQGRLKTLTARGGSLHAGRDRDAQQADRSQAGHRREDGQGAPGARHGKDASGLAGRAGPAG